MVKSLKRGRRELGKAKNAVRGAFNRPKASYLEENVSWVADEALFGMPIEGRLRGDQSMPQYVHHLEGDGQGCEEASFVGLARAPGG